MGNQHEVAFENDICQHLAAHGWLYAEGDAAGYDRATALFTADLIEWVKQADPTAWKTLEKDHGQQAAGTLAARVRQQLDARGTVDVLRHGVDVLGLKGKLELAQFRPALATDAGLARYDLNRLRVVRQVHYSTANGNSLDLVLFLNGLPVATAELKSNFTQNVQDAVDQYLYDRDPRPKGRAAEPLLAFPGGAVVHFAVSNTEVAMSTRLAGKETRFLPFNRGTADGGAGNPPNPGGHPTAYLWEQVWQRDSWLEILGRYVVAQRDGKKQEVTGVIFPRYHQLDAVRKLRAAMAERGPGGRYLIQHSAGSGKTNSIAWAAHHLADLHDAATNKKLFATVLVVSDRNVIDAQLQEAIFGFERTVGVVATITGEGGSKSKELAGTLSGDKKVVVCTIQTFPHALQKVRELAATEGKRFAVIADEAHSSQTGEAAAKLKAVLSPEEQAELADGGEISTEDVLAAQMATRADESAVTYVAFTATPKSKTLELFGTRPDPTRRPAKDNVPEPFHVYTMRQAIEERFILDVLQNYTSYRLAFKLTHHGKEWDDKQVERSAAMRGIMGWVRLHPYNIAQKVEVVVEHYRQFVAPLLGGRAKGLVVVASRREAVRWKVAIDQYVRDHGYPVRTLVAFSGEVTDDVTGTDPVTEANSRMNPDLRGRDIREAFATDEYQLLLVANKFQTGFDQPLLCGMYVDKKLAGIQAVQTLSRLNRAYPGKDTTYVLDFASDAEEVLAAFRTYHKTAQLAGVTDPYLVQNLKERLDAAGHYDEPEVNRVVEAFLRPTIRQAELTAAVTPVTDRLLKRYKAARDRQRVALEQKDQKAADEAKAEADAIVLFRDNLGNYVRVYTFLSQIIDYRNTDLEKRSIFYKVLLPTLQFDRERDVIDLSQVVLTHHNLRSRGKQAMPLDAEAGAKLQPTTDVGTGNVQEKEKARLAEVIEKVNDLFDGDLTPQDKLVYVNDVIKGKLLESETLRQQAANNTKEQFAHSPDLTAGLLNAIMTSHDAHTLMSTQALGSEPLRQGLKDVLLNHAHLWEALRQLAAATDQSSPSAAL